MMNNRRTATPLVLRSKPGQAQNATLARWPNYANVAVLGRKLPERVPTRGHHQTGPAAALAAHADAIRRSTSFKNGAAAAQCKRSVASGCTYYGEGFACGANRQESRALVKPKSVSRRKRITSVHKTSTNWNRDASYGPVYGDPSSQTHFVQPPVLPGQLPAIERKPSFNTETVAVEPDTAGKRDAYIKYIIGRRKARMHAKPVDSARRDSRESDDARSVVLGGINFAIHPRRGASPGDGAQPLSSGLEKEMSLMNYDFNGAGKRAANVEPKNAHHSGRLAAQENKTAERSCQKLPGQQSSHTISTHDTTTISDRQHSSHEEESPDLANSVINAMEESRKRSPPVVALANNSKSLVMITFEQ